MCVSGALPLLRLFLPSLLVVAGFPPLYVYAEEEEEEEEEGAFSLPLSRMFLLLLPSRHPRHGFWLT